MNQEVITRFNLKSQFEQMLLYYNQLKNMALEIQGMLERESYNEAITMSNHRERVYRELSLMLNYIILTPEQQDQIDVLKKEIQELDEANLKKLLKDMEDVKYELDVVTSKVRFRHKYNPYESEGATGNVVDTRDNA